MTELFLKIFNISISASFLVLAVVLLRLLLKKAPRWLHVMLWALVALRLLWPFSIESTLSLIPSTETVSPEIMMAPYPQIQTGIPSVNAVINPIIGQSFAPNPMTSANPLQILIPVAALLWLCGIGLMLLYSAVSYWLLRRRVATAVRLRDDVYSSERVGSPFVLGIVRPRIYLPFSLEEGEAEHVIAHERMHIARKDHWWKPLGFFLLAVHWFNPVLWVSYILLCRDIELACDEKVVATLNRQQRADYSQALLRCSCRRWRIAACPLAFGEVGVKSRVKNVLHYKKPAFWVVAAALTAFVILAVCFLTNPPTASLDKITGQQGYTIQQQTRANLTLSVPKEAIPDIAYTEGHSFEKDEVIAYQTDTTSIYLERVQPANEGDDKLYFFFNCAYDLPDSGRILLPYWQKQDDTVTYGLNLNSRDLRDSVTVYPNAVSVRSHGPGEQFGFYVDTTVCKAATGILQFQVFCVELHYVKNGENSLLLSQVEDRTYAVTEVCYHWPLLNFAYVPGENTPSYAVSEANALLSMGEYPSVGWTELGYLTRVTLSPQFDALFTDDFGWQSGLSAELLRKNNANAWVTTFAAENGQTAEYYLLQQKDGSVYLAVGLGRDTHELQWLFQLAVDTQQTQSLLAVSGSSAAAVGTADDFTPLRTMIQQAQPLNISFEEPVPFRVYADGQELSGLYNIYDAETLQALDFLRPSGLDAQTYLFQNAEYGKRYLVTLSSPGTNDEVLYFLAVLPEEKPVAPEEPRTMTLADVLTLSEKGMDLTWEDLAPFRGTDIGSGLYIVRYEIDPAWSLIVSDGKTEGTPMSVALHFPSDDGGVDIREADVAKFIRSYAADSRDILLEAAIKAHYAPQEPDGLIHTQAWVVLANELVSGTPTAQADTHAEMETVYLLVQNASYSVSGGALAEVGGSLMPAAVTFDIDSAGQYRELTWWEPRDGAYHAEDIRTEFPGSAAEDALNPQKYAAQLQNVCLQKARETLPEFYTDAEALLDEIVKDPAASSNPGDYIAAHASLYRKLLDGREETLRYCFKQFLAGNQTDVRGHVMAICCRDIMTYMGEAVLIDSLTQTGQDWFDEFAANADELQKQYSAEDIEKYYPATRLLLELKG